MTITPTDKGAIIAGGVFWTLIWTIVLKLNHVPLLNRVLNTQRILGWIRGHATLTLVCSEVVNLSLHPPSSPASAMFAFGGTLVNMLAVAVIWATGRAKPVNRFV